MTRGHNYLCLLINETLKAIVSIFCYFTCTSKRLFDNIRQHLQHHLNRIFYFPSPVHLKQTWVPHQVLYPWAVEHLGVTMLSNIQDIGEVAKVHSPQRSTDIGLQQNKWSSPEECLRCGFDDRIVGKSFERTKQVADESVLTLSSVPIPGASH